MRSVGILFLLVVAMPAVGRAQSSLRTLTRGDPLPYKLIEPSRVQPDTPIVIALHGVGSNNRKFARVINRLFKLPYRIVIPNAPYRSGRGYSWYKIRSASSDADVTGSGVRLLALVEAVRDRWPEAPRPALVGYSQGAVMVLHMTANHGDRFSAAVALAGYLVPSGARIESAARDNAPLFVSNGRNDKTILFQEGREAVSAFQEHGYSVTFRPHSGGHGCPRRIWREGAVWLQKQLTP